jgi:ribosomal protein S21
VTAVTEVLIESAETQAWDRSPALNLAQSLSQPNGRIEVRSGEAGLDTALKKLSRQHNEVRSELRKRRFFTPPSEARKHKHLRAMARHRTLARKAAKSL